MNVPTLPMVTGPSLNEVGHNPWFRALAERIFKVYTPYVHTVPLPSSTPTLVPSIAHNDNALYPIHLLSNPPLAKENQLETIFLNYPIHIHTPHAHIGTIHGLNPGQSINGLDLFRSLQILAERPLDARTTYSRLSQQMKVEVQSAFMHRSGRSSSSTLVWQAFTSGQLMPGGPRGEDLLLGYVDIWGVEGRSVHDCSVIHLA